MRKTKIQVLSYECSKCNFGTSFLSNQKINTKCKVCGNEMTFYNSRNYNPKEALRAIKSATPQTKKNIAEQLAQAKEPIVTCPYCQSTKCSRISILGRMVSVEFWGFASNKLGKQWHCHDCGSNF